MTNQRTDSQENIMAVDASKQTDEKKTCLNFLCLRWFVFGSIAFIALAGLIAAIVVYELYRLKSVFRVNCLPDVPLNYPICMERGCKWHSTEKDDIPSCYFPDGYGYKFVQDPFINETGCNAILERTVKNKLFGNEKNLLDLIVYYETKDRLHFKIVDKEKGRYEVPLDINKIDLKPLPHRNYIVELVDKPQFGIQIRRNLTEKLIFDSNTPGMIFSDQFLQITIVLPSSNIYGLGEHRTETYKHDINWKKWTFFARDQEPLGDGNLYGVHPFYMNVESDGNAHGVFFLNSNALQVVLQPHPAITFQSIGGIMDFYVFMGPTPENVVQQYLELVGKPMMPSYWSLGFQLSMESYGNLSNVKEIVEKTRKANISHDVQYFGMDYMEGYKVFTFDDKFGNLPKFVNFLNKMDIKAGILLHPAIASNTILKGNYPPLDKGLELDIFIKLQGKELQTKAFPGLSYYPDFMHPKIEEYWYDQCKDFFGIIPFDILLLDRNEPMSFVDGSINGCVKNNWNYPPYSAGVLGANETNKLYIKTICMDSVQNKSNEQMKHYDVHNVYGHFQSVVTYNIFKKILEGKRPMVLSSSTYPGSGTFTGHWLGKNRSWWSHLRNSIPGILEFSLFGIPYVGANICGFWGNVTTELCARWSQLGAFYPLSRNQNGSGFKPQDPVTMGELVAKVNRQALMTRYMLLPYLYTLFHYAHTVGTTVSRPLLHEFPEDSKTLDIDYQFLWGPALLISPVVNEGVTEFKAYLPIGRWYDFYNGELTLSKGEYVTLKASWDKIHLHVRGGYILPMQIPALTTTESRRNPMKLFIAPNSKGNAVGSLFWDDGESVDTFANKAYLMLNFKYIHNKKVNQLDISIEFDGYTTDPSKLIFSNIIFCDQNSNPSQIEVNGMPIEKDWIYDKALKVLYVNGLKLRINSPSKIILK